MKKGFICGLSSVLALVSLVGCNKNETPSYTITFKNYDLSVLESIKVKQGEMPVYSGETPTRPASAGYTYEFKGWLPEITVATSDAEYIATYDENINVYTVSFDSDGGTPVNEQKVNHGNKATRPTNPTKQSTEDYRYTFLYWYNVLEGKERQYNFNSKVTSDINLKALWLEEENKYTVSFETFGGTRIASQEIKRNGKVTRPTNPTHDATVEHLYSFVDWYESEDCTGSPYNFNTEVNASFTLYAKWDKQVRNYTVNFYNGDVLLDSKQVAYNQVATYTGATPTKSEDDSGIYTFNGWEPSITSPITGDTNFYANFTTVYKYDHYVAKEGSCILPGTKEFWVKHADSDDFYFQAPQEGVSVDKGTPSEDIVRAIVEANPSDVRLTGLGNHNFVGESNLCSYCHQVDITARGLVLDDHHTMVDDETHVLEDKTLVKMNSLHHEYNNGVDKFISQMFTEMPLGNIETVRFYVASGTNHFFLKSTDGFDYTFKAGETRNIIANKNADNSWTVSVGENDDPFMVYDSVTGNWHTELSPRSFDIAFASTLKDLFNEYSWSYNLYISNILAAPNGAHTPEYGDLIPGTTASDCQHDGTFAHYECLHCDVMLDENHNYVSSIRVPGQHDFDENYECRVCHRTNLMSPGFVNVITDFTYNPNLIAPIGFSKVFDTIQLRDSEYPDYTPHTFFNINALSTNFKEITFAVKNNSTANFGFTTPSDGWKLYFAPTVGVDGWVIITARRGANGMWTLTNDLGYWICNGTLEVVESITANEVSGSSTPRFNNFMKITTNGPFKMTEMLATKVSN